MAKIYPEIKRLGGEIFVVSFAPASRVASYLQKYPQPFPVVSDPTLAAYKGFNLTRASVGSLFRPGVIGRFVKLIFRGWLPKKAGKGDDLLQLGGDFVLDKSGHVVYAYPMPNPPTDPPMRRCSPP